MEIEYKLSPVPRERLDAVLRDGALAPCLSPPRTIEMHTVYYDTADGALARARIALRLRLENGAGVCTVKAPGGAPHERLEYECPAHTLEEGLAALLATSALPDWLAQALTAGVFVTAGEARFTRTAYTLSLPGLCCELAGDYGALSADGRMAPIAELELELLSGDAGALASLAVRLSRDYDLPAQPLSKYARLRALKETPHE
ncbi:MAG: hypothetical protein ABT01_00925 [Clostridium sp. SCN 57-10]|nr:MAG: hypothetical protein ABT01_00925 [Clostridium sp. SCN 57-10]